MHGKFCALKLIVGSTCPRLSNPNNGTVSVGDTSPGSNVTYSCDSGCTWSGNQTRICQSDGTWSGNASTCECMYVACKISCMCVFLLLLS